MKQFLLNWKYFVNFCLPLVIFYFSCFLDICLCSNPPKLLVIAFDGFRWDYLNRVKTPNFDNVIKNGVHARYGIENQFLTKTFPNFYSLATGLYVESHGVVANKMYDPSFKSTFDLCNMTNQVESMWFDTGAEPIWVTNEMFASNRRSGVLDWPGGSASVKNVLPSKYTIYDCFPKEPFQTRIEIMLSWFMDSRSPINLGHLYFDEPDATGHKAGPETEDMNRVIRELDSLLGYLLKRLKDEDLFNEMNIIITSDHGMTSTPLDEHINLNEFVDPSTYDVFSASPVLLILPHQGKTDEIYNNLSSVGNLTVYRKKDIPDKYHIKNNRRILPLLVVAKENHTLLYKNFSAYKPLLGTHGYDNSLKSMHPFFMAMGPAFKKNVSIDTFNSVDIYPMMCHILGLKPAPNNGSLQNIISLLKEDEIESGISTFSTYIAILVFGGLIGGIFSIAACRQYRYSQRRYQRFSLQGLSASLKYASTPNNNDSARLLSDSEEEVGT